MDSNNLFMSSKKKLCDCLRAWSVDYDNNGIKTRLMYVRSNGLKRCKCRQLYNF